jgi:hypothetical protein
LKARISEGVIANTAINVWVPQKADISLLTAKKKILRKDPIPWRW